MSVSALASSLNLKLNLDTYGTVALSVECGKNLLFPLSSPTGNSATFGGFAPFFEGAYGVCYGILDHGLNVCITHTRGGRTDASAFRDALESALMDLQKLCIGRNVAYMSADVGGTAASAKL